MKRSLHSALALGVSVLMAASCLSACGGGKDHDHTYEWTTQTPATCILPGRDRGVCSICGNETYRDVAALGHSYGEAVVETPADCVTDGVSYMTCTRCGEPSDPIVVPKLGHNFVYQVVTPATFESTGVEEGKCSRCEETDERVIPMLDKNTPIEYTFRVTRTNGTALTATGMEITVYKTDGTVAATGKPTAGTFRAKLLPQTYTVKVSGAPLGYSPAPDGYTVSAGDPNCAIVLTGSPIQGTPPENTRYRVNSLMYDFTLTALDGSKITLSEVLQTKKGVILNFWATWCTWCIREFPDMQKLWEEYSDDVLLVAIDCDSNENEKMAADFLATFKDASGKSVELTFPAAYNTSLGLFDMFGFSGYPSSVLIDREGVVTRVLGGYQTEAQWRAHFESLAGKKA